MYNPYEEFERNDAPLSDQIKQQLLQEKAQSEQSIIDMQQAEKANAQPAAKAGTPVQQQQSQSQTQSTNPEDQQQIGRAHV